MTLMVIEEKGFRIVEQKWGKQTLRVILPDWIIDATDHPRIKAYASIRTEEQIQGICLHQAGCHLGNRPERWKTVITHFGIPRDGSIILVNHPYTMPWASNYFVRRSISIEVGGNFRGLEGKGWTLWKGGGRRSVLNDGQVEACKKLIGWLLAECPRIRTLWAHRQTNPNKRGDPGEAIWRRIALPVIEDYGLDYDPNYTHPQSKGLKIPQQWDPERATAKY